MIEIAPLLRKAYVSKLSNLVFFSKVVPVWDTFEKEATIYPNINNMQAYILIKDITVNDDSPKCSINEDVSIQVQVVTMFNANTGESLYSEQLGNTVLGALMPFSRNRVDIGELGNEQAWSWIGRKVSARQINSETATTRIFSRNYIFSHKITQ